MKKNEVRRTVFVLKLIVTGLLVFAAVWLCVYAFAFLPHALDSDEFSDIERSNWAITLIVVNIGMVVITFTSLGVGLFIACVSKLEKDFSVLDNNERADLKRYVIFRILADAAVVALGAFLIFFMHGLGGRQMLVYRLPSLLAAGAAMAVAAFAEGMQFAAVRRKRKILTQ